MDEKMMAGVYFDLIPGVTYGPIRGVTYDIEDAVETPKVPVMSRMEQTEPVEKKVCAQMEVIKAESSEKLNFTLKLVRRIIVVEDRAAGETNHYLYYVKVMVRRMNGEIIVFEDKVASEKIKSYEWLKRATNSLASVPQDKEEKSEFFCKVQMCIEEPGVPIEVIYPTPGWRKIDRYGWRFVHATGMIGEDSAFIHTNSQEHFLDVKPEMFGTRSCFQQAMSMVEVCKRGGASMELFLFAHTALLTSIFKEAGYPIFFVFGLAGVTNSRKTSLVLALTKIFNRENLVADAEFATATSCGIEKELGKYRDGVVIIDDFKPGVNRSQQRVMDEKLDQLLRFYGNRVEKKRMQDFSGKEEKYFPIQGACVLTMEIVTGVMSSIARMFISEINTQDVDNEKLRYFQENRWILSTHMADFLLWVTQNFNEVVNEIRNTFPIWRAQYKFSVARFAEMYATFMMTGILIGKYAEHRAFCCQNDSQLFVDMVDKIIRNELSIMGIRIKKSDKANLIIEALVSALKSGKLLPLPLNSDTAKLKEMCYEDGDHIYIRTKELKKISHDYCMSYHEQLEIVNENEIIGLLERLQILSISYKSGKEASRKLPIQNGNTYRYLYIRKDKLQEFLENRETAEPPKPLYKKERYGDK